MRSLTEVEFNMLGNLCAEFEEWGLFEEFYSETPEYISIYEGATRRCFVLDGLGNLDSWVIKVDLRHVRNSFNEREVENYHEAIKADLAMYFAATYKVYTCEDGRVVIAQERVTTNEEGITDSFYKYARTNLINMNDYEDEDHLNDEIWDVIYDMDDYDRVEALFGGDSRIRKLHNFLREHNINDLHEGNWGESDYNGMVMIDFAGYY